jgi:8-amino-7-oxononanoate synthase
MRRTLANPLARLRERHEARERAGLRRRLRPRSANDQLIDLAGNDYLGLARDPRVVAAAVDAAQTWGAGSTGSRLVTGSTELHAQLEQELAAHCGAAAALVFSSGYLANLGVLTALAAEDTVVVSDAHNHASVIDACRLARARVVVVPHRDVAAVESALASRNEESAIVVTDAVFSVDGDIAPVAELHSVARAHGALLVVDEAHALGVIGDHGEGVVSVAGLAAESDIVRTLTLSKSLGSQGGAIVAGKDIVDYLISTARTFIFDTALAPAAAGAALEALRVLVSEPTLATAVRANAQRLADLVGVAKPNAAIVAVPVASPQDAVTLTEMLADRGVRVGCFRPPSVPDGVSRLRMTARADLSDADLTLVASALPAQLTTLSG